MLDAIKKSVNYTTSLGGKANPQITRFIRYSSAGGFSFALDLMFLFILTEIFGLFYIFSAILAFTTATSINYLINLKWGFKNSITKTKIGYISFVSINLTTLVLIVALLSLLVEILGFHYFMSRILVGIIIGIINFIANSKITFKTKVLKN